MTLQTLLFFAQSWHLKIYHEPLFDVSLSTWSYGPVVPSLYHRIKNYRKNNVTALVSDLIHSEDGSVVVTPTIRKDDLTTLAFINKITEVYGPLGGTELSYLTHLPEPAWTKAQGSKEVITNSLMKECIGDT